jgi:vacuolar-type H+-ATPase subunit E/Vma4
VAYAREKLLANKKRYRLKHHAHIRAHAKEHYVKNAERIKASVKQYKSDNLEAVRDSAKRSYAKHRGTVRARKKQRYLQNRDKVLERNKVWRLTNVEKVKLGRKRHYVQNRQKVNAAISKYKKRRMQIDPAFKLRDRLCKRVQFALKRCLAGAKARKATGSMKLIGADIDWLMAWLEVQFKPGMTWENYGSVWHADHVQPCASFDLTDHQQQKLCFHWTNLQPLFAEENLAKGAKWKVAA